MDSKISQFDDATLAQAKELNGVIPIAVPGTPGSNRKVAVSEFGAPVTVDSTLDSASPNPIANQAVAAALHLLQVALAPEYVATEPYDGGSVVSKGYKVYKAKRDTAAGWTEADWEEVNIADLLKEYNMQPAYFKTQQLASYELTGAAATATFSPAADVTVQLSRMDDGSGGVGFLSAAVRSTISMAKVSMGGAGQILARTTKSADVVIDAVIPAAASATDAAVVLQSFTLSLGAWEEWEQKSIEIAAVADASGWKSAYQASKPVTLVAEDDSVFYIEDFNVQDDFVGETLPVFLELAVKADKFCKADMTEA